MTSSTVGEKEEQDGSFIKPMLHTSLFQRDGSFEPPNTQTDGFYVVRKLQAPYFEALQL